jgi:serine/threonine-protein kinase
MPYVEGETLRERLNREGQLPLADAVAIARETADALAYAHEHGVVHRDIKPENLLLTGGHAMVADFGVARAVGEETQQLTGTGLSVGTPAYMSPEQASAGHVDGRSDIYALGCVLYEMLAGEPPYTAPTPMLLLARVMTEPYRPLRAVRHTVPPALDQVVATALARSPADRYVTAAQMARALEPSVATPAGATLTVPTRRRVSSWLLAGLGVGLVLLVATVVLLNRPAPRAGTGDPDLIAVAPFDLVSTTPELAVWSEGIVDVVARYFDGAGTLRAVAPTRAIRAWNGRADRESAERFGRSLAAGYVVFGQLVGSDSVRLSATLYDVAAGKALDEHEWRGILRGIDRLADSLSTRFLDVLGRTRQVGTRRADPIGTSNPLAIREFLSGMRDFRRAAYGDAAQHFLESVRQDTGFVLGRVYGKEAFGWAHAAGDSTAIRFSLEAGARNRGLTRRDSLLILADSIDAAIYLARGPAFQLMNRLAVVMDTLLAAYPDDPELVYWAMDENYHLNPLGRRERWHLEGFKHAIGLDSLFAPAYEHAIELSAMLDPPEDTRALIRAMLAVPRLDSVRAGALRLADELLDSTVSPARKQAALDSAPERVLRRARGFVQLSPDSLSIMAARTIVTRFPKDPQAPQQLNQQLLLHGHLREAAEMLADPTRPRTNIFLARDLASLGVISLATFDSLYDERAKDASFLTPIGVPLWIAARDTVRLQRLYERFVLRLQQAPAPQRESAAIALEFLAATLRLARGDSSWFKDRDSRIRRLVPPGMQAETPFGLFPVEMALALHDEDRAWTLLQSRNGIGPTTSVLWMLHRARLAEKRGEREIAQDDYRYVARLWADADEPLRSFAREAKDGLARVSAEP